MTAEALARARLAGEPPPRVVRATTQNEFGSIGVRPGESVLVIRKPAEQRDPFAEQRDPLAVEGDDGSGSVRG